MKQQTKRQAPVPKPPDPLDLSIGLRVRQLRQQRAVSIQAVAQLSGLSIGFVSQVERGLSSPSVRDLMRIAAALGTDFNLLVDAGASVARAAADGPIVRLEDRRDIAFFDGIQKQLLSPPTESALFLYMVTIEPHGRAGETPYAHSGEEAGLVLQGRLLLTIDATDYLLNEGDSFRFRSTTPHRFSNPTASVARVLWVNVKPSIPAEATP
ncbi:cupin domain-containing protein [Humitalea sp. 24SJ18S-53]|uniref:cupin domain-containing protein n=1 Tax=Humitalea sp. 24SJ18S-53 TaxID=3422307 RepID=UPI003D6726E2